MVINNQNVTIFQRKTQYTNRITNGRQQTIANAENPIVANS